MTKKGWPNKIKIVAEMDRCGNIILSTKNKRYGKAFARIVKENGGPDEETAFFQQGFGASEFIEDLTPRQRKDLENGWEITFLIDPWLAGHFWGYDAHTLVESGKFRLTN